VIGEEDAVALNPPGLDVAVYVTLPFPVYAGAENETVACALPAVADTLVGDPGDLPA
jgi:hypothetical protein